jgi:hypothetical protein
MMHMLADIETQGLEVMFYLFLGAALLVLSFFILRLIQENGYRLILLALLTATVGIGFDAFLPDTAPIRAQTLMRIAVIAALGGVGSLMLSTEKPSKPTATRRRKGTKDAD